MIEIVQELHHLHRVLVLAAPTEDEDPREETVLNPPNVPRIHRVRQLLI